MAEVSLSDQDSGQRVSVRSGDPITVTLKHNATTGFAWAVDECDTNVLVLEADDSTPAQDAAGGGGRQVLRFRAGAPGSTVVRLARRRRWDTSGASAQEVHFTVDVRG